MASQKKVMHVKLQYKDMTGSKIKCNTYSGRMLELKKSYNNLKPEVGATGHADAARGSDGSIF